MFYYFDVKHKAIAYANIKVAMQKEAEPFQLSRLTRAFYQRFGQNLIEMFLIPRLNKEYIDTYIAVEGLGHMREAFKKGKGVILLGVHAGSWELSNIISANLGFPFNLFVREQKFPRLEKLLNAYRCQKGCKLIQRKNQIRQLLEVLKNNEAVGMTVDQGGRGGMPVTFLGREASMAVGALKIALKYDVPILPAFYTRIKGPYIKTIIAQPFTVKKSGSFEKDLKDNLQELALLFERFILAHPAEYLWTYKIWKYGREKRVLILSDGKAGHLRQAQAVANIAGDYFKQKGEEVAITTQAIAFKSRLSRRLLVLSSCLAGRYHCQGCLWCLRRFLAADTYASVVRQKPDVIISCGASLAHVNVVLSRENQAVSLAVMRPSFLSTRSFNLVIMPRHDNPPQRKNVVMTEGALNLISEQYLKDQAEGLRKAAGPSLSARGFYIGFLIGGDAKNFSLPPHLIKAAIAQIKAAAERLNAELLVTTSRRTSQEVEKIVRQEFGSYPRCKLLIIANEKNIPEAVGGLLGLSRFVVISPESISMISEAATSGSYVVVFDAAGLSRKHQRFIRRLAQNKYIVFTEPAGIAGAITGLWDKKPKINVLADARLIASALSGVL